MRDRGLAGFRGVGSAVAHEMRSYRGTARSAVAHWMRSYRGRARTVISSRSW